MDLAAFKFCLRDGDLQSYEETQKCEHPTEQISSNHIWWHCNLLLDFPLKWTRNTHVVSTHVSDEKQLLIYTSRRNTLGLTTLCVTSATDIYKSLILLGSLLTLLQGMSRNGLSQTSLSAQGNDVGGDSRTQDFWGRDLESVHKKDPYK